MKPTTQSVSRFVNTPKRLTVPKYSADSGVVVTMVLSVTATEFANHRFAFANRFLFFVMSLPVR